MRSSFDVVSSLNVAISRDDEWMAGMLSWLSSTTTLGSHDTLTQSLAVISYATYDNTDYSVRNVSHTTHKQRSNTKVLLVVITRDVISAPQDSEQTPPSQ